MQKINDNDIVNYIINNNSTAKETAEHFGISLSTIRKRLSNIKSYLQDDSLIKKQLLEVIDINQKNGRIKGGQHLNSGRKMNESIENIVNYAVRILKDNLTLKEASLIFNIPSSTLYEYLQLLNCPKYKDIYDDLLSLFEYHIQNKLNYNNEYLYSLQNKYSNEFESIENNKIV